MMEVEKKRSKGGFLNLFDWNGKSRKKLFLSNSESSGLKQGKENVESFSKSAHFRLDVDENGTTSSNKGSGDWNCASSVTSDESCGIKAPGVVARLMGLDSLPTSTVPEPSSDRLFDSQSPREPQHDRSNHSSWGDFYAVEYINMPKKLDRFSWNSVESRLLEMQNRPIERFQTEVLPPKSAKSIPVTHHKLLSPIKSPGFVATKDAAYILEAASKIIEANPRTSAKSKVSSVGPPSIPLRIRDLKDKMEAAQKASRPERPKEASEVRHMKGLAGGRSNNGSDNVHLPNKASVSSERQNYKDKRNKGKSVSLAEQAKANVQRRDGPTSCSNRSIMNQKEHFEVKQNQFSKGRPNTQRPAQKRTSSENSKSVLKQNNQKQNCMSGKDKTTPQNMVPNRHSRRMHSTNGHSQPSRTVNEVLESSQTGSGKMGPMPTATGRERSLSKMKNVSEKIRSVSGDVHNEDNVSDTAYVIEGKRSVKCNVSMDRYTNLTIDNRKQGMEVVSFTFTSPLKTSISEMQSPGQVMSNGFYIDSFGNDNQQHYPDNLTFSSPGFNVIGGDAVSVLLEQKLQELSFKVESSHRNLSSEVPSASPSSSLQEMVSSVASTTSRGKKLEHDLRRDKIDSINDYDCLSVEVNQQWQGSEGMEECSSSSINSATAKEYQHLSPVSAFEPSFESQICTYNRSGANGSDSERCSLAQAQDQINLFSSYETLLAYGGVSELCDSASSSTGDVSGKNMYRKSGFHDVNGTNNWELEYVRYILSNVDLEMEDFALGDAHNVITPSLFYHLDNQEEYPKLERKVLFDYVNESLQFRCKQIFVGSQKAWDRCAALSRRKGWLAGELYKEISGWKNMEELLGDELVEKDMSTQQGRWVDFEIEAFEEGLEIEKGILNSLVDELVSDFLLF